ncbi:HEAT repeat domain-containing protein [Fontisphaera persica]|uniref:HEAT repeat domain-containing protein n=1 Tax=Fontisphaera persica TaxID=2974023 RepID=UPI0024BF6A36|nr:HEAT repeat domain-containing protein [Fontisphaera persica]WCJ59533.1 HEAT repeat domain-containing protein [Fontisphaera persica]
MKKAFSLVLAVFCAASAAAQAPADPLDGLAKWSFGQSRESLARVEELMRKTAPADYPALEARLIAILKAPETSKDAKRYVCRYLGVVGSAKCVPALAELLTDADLSHPARMALEPLAAPEAGAALRTALPKVEARLRAGILGSIGVRRDPQAVEVVARYVHDPDPWVAETALAALGQIGTPAAAKVLASATVTPALSRALGRAEMEAAARLAATGNAKLARGILEKYLVASQPRALRVAAAKGMVEVLPATEAARWVVQSLQSDDAARREGAIAGFADSKNRPMQAAVAGELPQLPSAGQLLLLGWLNDLPDVPAREGLLKVVSTTGDEAVRAAALDCLARHGTAADVPLLAERAAGTGPAADAAKRALQRLGKPGVDEALLKLVETSAPAIGAVAVDALAQRRTEAAVPGLLRIMKNPDPALAVRGVRALGVIGRAENVKDLASLVATATQNEVRQAAESAIAAICRRSADKPALASAILPVLQSGPAPEAQAALLRLLIYTGGGEALQAVVSAMKHPNATVAKAATEALVAWPDLSAGPHLLNLARNAADANLNVVALRDGCLRLAEMEELPMAGRVDLLRGVLENARRPEEKKRALTILAELPLPAALETLQSASKDAALQQEAWASIIRLARQMGAVYPKQALAALEQVQAQNLPEALKQQAAQALKAIENAGMSPDGFVLSWLLSGPYVKEGKDGAALFEEVFPPEQTGGQAEWRPVTAARNGVVALDKLLRGGNDRVAYLKTLIVSEQEQEILLEMGSDDGIKVWLNGKVVHANNATRPCTPGQDKKKVRLVKGVNAMLVKITQGGGEWAGVVRLRTADGRDLNNVMVGPAAE